MPGLAPRRRQCAWPPHACYCSARAAGPALPPPLPARQAVERVTGGCARRPGGVPLLAQRQPHAPADHAGRAARAAPARPARLLRRAERAPARRAAGEGRARKLCTAVARSASVAAGAAGPQTGKRHRVPAELDDYVFQAAPVALAARLNQPGRRRADCSVCCASGVVGQQWARLFGVCIRPGTPTLHPADVCWLGRCLRAHMRLAGASP